MPSGLSTTKAVSLPPGMGHTCLLHSIKSPAFSLSYDVTKLAT